MPEEGELRELIAAMESLVPGIRAAVGAPAAGDIVPGGDNAAALGRLFAGVRRDYPGAGPLFWSVRSWNMIEWQPAAVAVLGVHVAGVAPRLDRMSLALGDGSSCGFGFPTGAADRGAVRELISVSGRRLRRLADMLLADLGRVIPVKRQLAERLLADRVLGILARLSATRADMPAAAIAEFGERWLAAMSLEGASGLVPVTLCNGREQPVLDRRSCCLEYRASGAVCATCPKLPPAARHERMRRYWEEHVSAH